MSQVSNDQIYAVLLDIKEDIGSMNATLAAHQSAFTTHVAEDKQMAEDINKIELRQASMRGERRTWNIVTTAVGSVAGAIAAYLGMKGH